jgi:hypothetical protein
MHCPTCTRNLSTNLISDKAHTSVSVSLWATPSVDYPLQPIRGSAFIVGRLPCQHPISLRKGPLPSPWTSDHMTSRLRSSCAFWYVVAHEYVGASRGDAAGTDQRCLCMPALCPRARLPCTHSWGHSPCRILLINACWHEVIRKNSRDSVLPFALSPPLGRDHCEYYPSHAGELLVSLRLSCRDHADRSWRPSLSCQVPRGARYAERGPLRPADILVVLHPDPVRKVR